MENNTITIPVEDFKHYVKQEQALDMLFEAYLSTEKPASYTGALGLYSAMEMVFGQKHVATLDAE